MRWADALEQLAGADGRFGLEDADVRGIRVRVYRHAPASLRDVFLSAVAHRDGTYLVFEGERHSYADAHRQAHALAHHLASAYGIVKGDRVAIAMRNYPEWAFAFWAAQLLGAVAVPINAWWTRGEIAHALADSGASLVVVDPERLERLPGGAGTCPALVVRHAGARFGGAELWTGRGRDVPALDRHVSILPDDPATIIYTSGTTGTPKGAVATHGNHTTNFMNMALRAAAARAVRGAGGGPASQRPPVVLQTYPFFHVAGISHLYAACDTGATLVLLHKWDTLRFLQLVERERVTALACVPTVLAAVVDGLELDRYDLSSLTSIVCGGAPVPPSLVVRVGQRLGNVTLTNSYGLTETTAAVAVNVGDDYAARPGSVGRALPTADIKVADPDGIARRAGEVGEIWCRGPNIVPGYWHDPEGTAAAFADGWFRTGDLGYLDEAGFLHVVDRAKDVVIRGGENVYSTEVELALATHASVGDVAVVGLPHDTLGEEVVAVVRRAGDTVPTERELQDHVAAQLAAFKVPARVVVRDAPLPRTSTGKVLKDRLRAELLGT